LTQFLIEFLASFRTMPQLAQHGDTEFFRCCDRHRFLDSFRQIGFRFGQTEPTAHLMTLTLRRFILLGYTGKTATPETDRVGPAKYAFVGTPRCV
jgi:hypothetical protein